LIDKLRNAKDKKYINEYRPIVVVLSRTLQLTECSLKGMEVRHSFWRSPKVPRIVNMAGGLRFLVICV
jgi:hypothetical protein